MKQLIGHTSAETAYVVDDYPYGFRLRTQIRYWIESKQGFGQRFVSQTLNPKNGVWNKPKAGTYSEIVMLGIDEDTNYVTQAALSFWNTEVRIREFAEQYIMDEFQIKQAKLLTAAARVSEKITWKINAGPATQTREEQQSMLNRAMNYEMAML